MTTPPEVVVHADRSALVAAVADRLAASITGVLAVRDTAHIVLTGGGAGTAVLAAMRHSAVDWHRVDLWWGDERFLPAGDADRNDTQAREALLDHVAVDPTRVHPMPTADQVDDVDAAARRYAGELATRAGGAGDATAVPRFDVLLLGVGDDGHVASLFPGLPGVLVDDRSVVGVRDSPKPPPLRVSLTVPAIQAATEVWLLVSGRDKAAAVRRSLAEEHLTGAPAAAARGREATIWFLDEESAGQLPSDVSRTTSD